jgi:hypothetical protein
VKNKNITIGPERGTKSNFAGEGHQQFGGNRDYITLKVYISGAAKDAILA